MVILIEEVLSSYQITSWRTRHDGSEDVSRELFDAALAHPLVRAATEPHRIGPIAWRSGRALAALQPTATSAISSDDPPFRIDLGITLLLTENADQTSSLLFDGPFGRTEITACAGTAIVWPANWYRGFPETGQAEICIAEALIQSLVPDPARREILYDLFRSASMLGIFDRSRAAEAETLRLCHGELLRMWAQP